MTSPVVASLLSLTLKISTGPLSVPLKTSLHLSYSFRHRPKFLPPHFLWWFVLNSSYLLIAHGSPSLSYSNNIVDLWMYGSSSPPNCFQGCAQLGAFTWGGPFFTLCFLSFSCFFFLTITLNILLSNPFHKLCFVLSHFFLIPYLMPLSPG